MTPRFLWVVAAGILGIVCFDVMRTLNARRRRAEIKDELVRWEGEGGNVFNA